MRPAPADRIGSTLAKIGSDWRRSGNRVAMRRSLLELLLLLDS
jgi:hypothetical protein